MTYHHKQSIFFRRTKAGCIVVSLLVVIIDHMMVLDFLLGFLVELKRKASPYFLINRNFTHSNSRKKIYECSVMIMKKISQINNLPF